MFIPMIATEISESTTSLDHQIFSPERFKKNRKNKEVLSAAPVSKRKETVEVEN